MSRQGYFDRSETFCADRSLEGRIRVGVASGDATSVVAVRALPPSSAVLVNWPDNRVRGWAVGTLATNPADPSAPASMHLCRPGETHGHGIVLATSGPQSPVHGTLLPCG